MDRNAIEKSWYYQKWWWTTLNEIRWILCIFNCKLNCNRFLHKHGVCAIPLPLWWMWWRAYIYIIHNVCVFFFLSLLLYLFHLMVWCGLFLFIFSSLFCSLWTSGDIVSLVGSQLGEATIYNTTNSNVHTHINIYYSFILFFFSIWSSKWNKKKNTRHAQTHNSSFWYKMHAYWLVSTGWSKRSQSQWRRRCGWRWTKQDREHAKSHTRA